MELIVAIASCAGTLIGAYFTYKTFKKADEINGKIVNQNVTIKGNGNTTQQHLGSGDNIGNDKNG